MLQGKKILIGVTGSIAAYKCALLIRLLKKMNAEVKVITTASASDFIGNITLATLSKNKVYTSFTSEEGNDWNNHVELGLWADLMIIYPATANTIAKMANGICDNFLLAVYLSAKCPVWLAPAMDLDMFLHPSTQQNLATISSFKNRILMPNHGELASGLVGKGRVEEPEVTTDLIAEFFTTSNSLDGKKILITSGPTYESLDPVRFIGNHSSGKMGVAIANEFANRGAEVVLVSGPSSEVAQKNIKRINVVSAEQMFQATIDTEYDIAVLAAAVADYTPVNKSEEKIKKSSDKLSIELQKTKDILAYLGENKKSHQVLIGFAMETENLIQNARAKLIKKQADLIVLNSLKEKDAGFKSDSNKVTFIEKETDSEFALKSKQQVAVDIVDKSVELLKSKSNA